MMVFAVLNNKGDTKYLEYYKYQEVKVAAYEQENITHRGKGYFLFIQEKPGLGLEPSPG